MPVHDGGIDDNETNKKKKNADEKFQNEQNKF